ncbi:MAG: polysaccharide deacetylase family protein [Clostridia bacterium]|nr:polysaccharide deacetylase family protein [Clostridia bacterium]
MRFLVVKKSGIIKTTVIAAVLALLLCAVGLTGAATVYSSGKTVRKLPIYAVETEEKAVALSFDASWGADKTQAILDTLTRYDIKANYFVVSFWAEKYPDMLKKLQESGRVEIGTHSNTHPHMSKLSRNQIELELSTSVDVIENITGKKPDLFRPPFGDYSDALLEEAEKQGLYTIQWDVDSLDWKDLSATAMAERVLKGVKNGSIVLMHNDGKHTPEALPLIIEGLKNKGYSFKTIGELIYRDNYEIDHTGRQIRR